MDTASNRILIAGGGIAALEFLLALRSMLTERVPVTLLAPQREFVVRASSVLEPFGRGEARVVVLDDFCAEHHAERVTDSLREVDAERSLVITAGGQEIPYGTLVVALGAVPVEPFPGALMFAGPQHREVVTGALGEAERGEVGSLAFVVPSGATWTLPVYELALLTRTHLRERGADDVGLAVVTPESRPLSIFGEAACDELEPRLADADISLHTLSSVRAHEDGELLLKGGAKLRADRAIALPRLAGPALEGLPSDDEGFIPIDDHGRVRGVANVYAAGDCTTFPVKQGGLAAQQADAVASSIAFAHGAAVDPLPFQAVLRGLLLTGESPLYLRAWPGAGREPSSVAIESGPRVSGPAPEAVAGTRPLWWPPSKIAGRYLGAWLMNPKSRIYGAGELVERAAAGSESEVDEQERAAALDLALAMADGEAAFGDWHAAMRALAAAQSLAGSLPPEYEQKREVWEAELRGSPTARFAG